MSRRPWKERIEDILDAVAEIQSFVGHTDFDRFQGDAKTLKAVTADLTIIGEAAQRIPEHVKAAHPDVPWALMSGMRNRIVHAYFDVDPGIVWDTVSNDLPQLVEPLRKILDESA